MAGRSTQTMRDAALLLLLLVLAATVRVTAPDPVAEVSWIPEAQAASTLPAFVSDAQPQSVPATSVTPAFDVDLDFDFQALTRDARFVSPPDSDSAEAPADCPARRILILRTISAAETADGPAAVPAPTAPTVQEIRITRHRSTHEEKGCST